MKTIIYPASERGSADYGWLKPNYYFSFAQYHDHNKVHFGLLRVLNDDFIAGGGGFPTHPHDNMEIITIPLEGALQHQDSTGSQGIIHAGDVQIMSAGSGVQHSEVNASATEPVKFFQIWIFSKEKNIKPSYDQRNFNVNERINTWQIIVSPKEEDNGLWINQDARLAITKLESGKSISYTPGFKNNGVYLVIISGSAEIDGKKINKRDAIGISDIDEFTVAAQEDSELLVIEIPMN